jgi:hypothetical protein
MLDEQAAADGPAPEGGTAGSASAKVPSATWPRDASEHLQRGNQTPRDLPEF